MWSVLQDDMDDMDRLAPHPLVLAPRHLVLDHITAATPQTQPRPQRILGSEAGRMRVG